MSLKPPHRPPEENEDAWLITFADMVTLLLCFFIIMFSMSSPDATQFKQVAAALREHGFYNDLVPQEDPYEKLKKQLAMSLGASGYDQFMAVSEQDHIVALDLSSSSFFERGSAKFTPEALPMLKLVASQLAPISKEHVVISVEGHTDDTPINTPSYPSNWELSSARAANVVRYLIASGFPAEKLRAVGFADTHPKAPNHDSQGNALPANEELNRRVVIKLLRNGGD
ncbi:MAG: flagellar motor protein MotB [Alphaproteobacteria bacterium]